MLKISKCQENTLIFKRISAGPLRCFLAHLPPPQLSTVADPGGGGPPPPRGFFCLPVRKFVRTGLFGGRDTPPSRIPGSPPPPIQLDIIIYYKPTSLKAILSTVLTNISLKDYFEHSVVCTCVCILIHTYWNQ